MVEQPASWSSLLYFQIKTLRCIITWTINNHWHNNNITQHLSVINQQHTLQSSTLIVFHHAQRTMSINKGYHLHCPNVTCYFLPLTSIYIPQHPAIKHTQFPFFFSYASTAIKMGKWKYSFLRSKFNHSTIWKDLLVIFLSDSFLLQSGHEIINSYLLFSAFTCTKASLLHFHTTQQQHKQFQWQQ